MTVDFVSNYTSPLGTNGGHEVVEAFQRAYGVDIRKACAVNSAYIDVQKVG